MEASWCKGEFHHDGFSWKLFIQVYLSCVVLSLSLSLPFILFFSLSAAYLLISPSHMLFLCFYTTLFCFIVFFCCCFFAVLLCYSISLSLTFSLHISCSLELVKYRQDPHGWLSLSIGHLCILRYYLASLNQR